MTVDVPGVHVAAGWGRGIVQDFRNTLGLWWGREMTNINQKTLAVSLFIFFACIAPAM